MLFREHVLSDVLPHLHINKNDNAHKLFFTSSQNSTFSLRHFKMIDDNNVHIIFILGNLQKQAMLYSRFLFYFIILNYILYCANNCYIK